MKSRLALACSLQGGGDVPCPEIIMNHDPGFGQMTHHGHVTALTLIGPFGRAFFRNDLGGINIQRVGRASELPEPVLHHPLIHPVQARQAFTLPRPAQPISSRIAAGQAIQMQQAPQCAIPVHHAQIFQRSAAAGQHQNQRQHMFCGGIGMATAGFGHLPLQPAMQTRTLGKLAQ